MIRVKITKQGFIRKGPGRSYAPVGAIFPSQKVLVMDGVEEGEAWQGISKWYYQFNNNKEKQYFWAGNATPLDQTTIVSPPTATHRNTSIPTLSPFTSPIIPTLGIDQIWADGERGDLAKVAILDSGIALNCPDLTGAVSNTSRNGIAPMKNFLSNSRNRNDDSGDVPNSRSRNDDSGDVSNSERRDDDNRHVPNSGNQDDASINIPTNQNMDDDYGHGSHCAGLIASRNQQHIVGVAPACQLYVGKIRDARTNVRIPTLLEGIRWAAGLEPDSPHDIDIISVSHGSLLNHPDMQPVINQVLANNKILVCAIGNRAQGGIPTGGFYPAVLPDVISVGAVDLQNNFLPFNYEFDNLTICCPGEAIFSYGVQGVLEQQSGTSQATAICAGVIALLVSHLKKRRADNIPQTIMRLLLSSESRTTDNNYQYRFMNAIQLYKTIH